MREVKSGFMCPYCGKEMRMTDGSMYYEYELGAVTVRCDDCHLEIWEFAHRNGLEAGEAGSYHKLVNALRRRLK